MAPDGRVTGAAGEGTPGLQHPARGGDVPLAVVILTHNEEANLPNALASVTGWAQEVWIVDSHSTDQTAGVARAWGAGVVTHDFSGYAAQRTWALRMLPFRCDWVLFLDADESVTPELRDELRRRFAAPLDDVAGFYVKRRFIFLGRWLRHGGYYPVWLLRVVRHRLARCEERGVDEHLLVDGPTDRLEHDLLHEDRRPLARWVERHTRYAQLAAADLVRGAAADGVAPRLRGGEPSERSRWWYERVYRRTPLGLRALGYFTYRYVLRGGFLDGREGLIYYVLQALWYRVLIDAYVLETRRGASEHSPGPRVISRADSSAER